MTPKLTLGLVLILSLASPAFAIEGALRFEHLGPENGLTVTTLNALTQDPDGFIWIGSSLGLQRFDGVELRNFRHDPDDPGSLPHNDARNLFVDSMDRMWVSTRGGGLALWLPDTESFRNWRHDPEDSASIPANYVQVVYETSDGILWLGTRTAGLVRFDSADESFSGLPFGDEPGALASSYVTTIYEDRFGVLWVGTRGGGLHRYDRSSEVFHRYDPSRPPGNTTTSFVEDEDGKLWLGTEDGVVSYDRDTDVFVEHPGLRSGLPSGRIFTAKRRDGSLLLGTGEGLGFFDPVSGVLRMIRADELDPRSLAGNGVRVMLEDRSGVLWVGNEVGLDRHDPATARFQILRHDPRNEESLPSDDLWQSIEGGDDQLWIGTGDSGLARLDPVSGRFDSWRHDPDDPASLPNDSVFALVEDTKGRVWIGTRWGLARWDGDDRPLTIYPDDSDIPGALRNSTIYSFDVTPDGELWVAHNRGAERYRPQTDDFEHCCLDPDDADGGMLASTFSVIRDGDDLWLGTFLNGLFVRSFETGEYEKFRPDDESNMPSMRINAMHQDSKNRLWFGTQAGLARLEDRESKRFQVWRERDGLPSDVVVAFAEFSGELWVGTANGLARFNPRTDRFDAWRASDGMPSSFVSFHGLAARRDGSLVVNTDRGFAIVDPDSLHPDPIPPQVALTDFELFGVSVPIGEPEAQTDFLLESTIGSSGSIRIGHRQKVLAFELATLHFADPARNQIAWKLEGFDPDWTEMPASRRIASYTNLPSGDYRLLAKAANKDGVWSVAESLLELRVDPAPWRSPLAYAGYALAALLLFAGIGRWRIGSVRSEMARLQSAALLQRKSRELETMVEMGRVLSALDDPETVARRLGLLVSGQLDLESWAVIGLREGREPLFVSESMEGIDEPTTEDLDRVAGRLKVHGIHLNVVGQQALQVIFLSTSMTPRLSAIVPITSGETLAGMLLLGPREDELELAADQLELVSELCAQAVVGFEAAWQAQEAKRWRAESEARRDWEKLDRFARLVFVAIARGGYETTLHDQDIRSFLVERLASVGHSTDDGRIREAIRRLVEADAVERTDDGRLLVANVGLLSLPETARPIAELARETLERIGAYRLEQRIGAGGMGEVYRAINVVDGSEAAVKIMFPHVQEDPVLRQRFEREGAIVASISSPNIVHFLERGEHSGRLYLAMELIDGESVRQVLQRGERFTITEAVGAMWAMANGLAALHRRDVFHRDLTPNNLMRRADGSWVLLDLGLATGLEAVSLTNEGLIIGTMPYMSPERLRGKRGDARCDVWALGVVAFKMITGVLPWTKTQNFAMVNEIIDGPAPTMDELERLVSPELAAILAATMERDLAARLQDADAVLEAMKSLEGTDLGGLAPELERPEPPPAEGDETIAEHPSSNKPFEDDSKL